MNEAKILVTGGTGTLGRPTVQLLRAAAHDVRVLSRKPGPGTVLGDLKTGEALGAALDGVKVVVHLATGKNDAKQTENLIEACLSAGVSHLIYISIVGIDEIPFAYYKTKVACEQLIEASGVPHTILRATQFHEFVVGFLGFSAQLPFSVVLDVSDQPIAVTEVAARLVELVDVAPAGRVADIGGPEQLTLRELAEQWHAATGDARSIRTLKLPGKTVAAFKRGHHLTPLPGFGTQTFAQFATAAAADRGTNKP